MLALLLTGGILILMAIGYSFWIQQKAETAEGPEIFWHTPHDDEFFKKLEFKDLGERVVFTSPSFPEGISIDRVELAFADEASFYGMPAVDVKKRTGSFPGLRLSWPAEQDFPGERVENTCGLQHGSSLVEVLQPVCLHADYSVYEGNSDDAVVEAIYTGGRTTLGIRKDRDEQGEAYRVASHFYQWGRFVTAEIRGQRQWLGWICNPNILKKLNREHGIPDDGEGVAILDAGNAHCMSPPGFWQNLFSDRNHTQYHDVVFHCRVSMRNRSYLNCMASFLFGGEVLTVYFPSEYRGGRIHTGGRANAAVYYRPRIVESAWKRLQQMQQEGASSELAAQGTQRRLQWSQRHCQLMMESVGALPRQRYKPIEDVESRCQRTRQRLIAAWHNAAGNQAAREHYKSQVQELDSQLAALIQASEH